jgi:hypothetical protein
MIKILWFVDIVEKYRILKWQCSYISFPTCLYRVQNMLRLSHFPYFPSWFITMQIAYFVKRKGTNECVLLLLLLLMLVQIFSRFIVGSSTQVLRVLDSALDTTGSTVPPCSYFPFFNWCYLKLINRFSEKPLLMVLFFCLYSLYTMVSMPSLFHLVLIMLHFSWYANS